MQFLKKHYEKVLLSFVLLGLAVAAAALPYMVSQVTEQIDTMVTSVRRSKPKPWTPLDLSTNAEAVRRIEGPVKVQLAGYHNLLNPVRWIKTPDGRVRKIITGEVSYEVTHIEPLELVVSFDSVSTVADRLQYTLTVIKETSNVIRTNQRTAAAGVKSQFFTIERVVGPPEAPEALMLRLRDGSKDERELITVTRDQPFRRLTGYTADIAFPPEREEFKRKRVDDKIKGRGETESYKIVAITENEVVLSNDSTSKKTTIKLKASPP